MKLVYMYMYLQIFNKLIGARVNHIGSVMVNVLVESLVDHGFCQVKPKTIYNIGICSFSGVHIVLRSRSKDWLESVNFFVNCCFSQLSL